MYVQIMKKLIFSFFLVFSLLLSAQTQPQQPGTRQQPPQNPQQAQPEKPQQPPPNRVEIEPVQPEHKITPEEAQELFRSMDEILQFASKDTLLPIKHPVKKAIVSREEVEKYVEDKFKNDVDAKRFERSELVLKKFGLLPRKFDLHTFMVKLLGEQVAGFYDEKTKTMNLLDWLSPEEQRPVMAHELTHALQDQNYDLEKMNEQDEKMEKKGLKDPNAQIKIDEESTARSAVLEGQAMIVLLDYTLAPTGRTVESSPGLVDMMGGSMDATGSSPLFDSAPLLLREELTFPYISGMKFIAQLLKNGGKALAFKGALDRLPVTSQEIMQPSHYLTKEHAPPLLLPDLKFLNKEYETFDAGAMGEVDVSILLKEYGTEKDAGRLTPEWRGGSYYAAGRKGAQAAAPGATGHIGLLYVSKWSSEEAASDFARIYSGALGKRYAGLQPQAADPANSGTARFTSADGPIVIARKGNLVIAVESFDDANAARLIDAIVKQEQDQSQGSSGASL